MNDFIYETKESLKIKKQIGYRVFYFYITQDNLILQKVQLCECAYAYNAIKRSVYKVFKTFNKVYKYFVFKCARSSIYHKHKRFAFFQMFVWSISINEYKCVCVTQKNIYMEEIPVSINLTKEECGGKSDGNKESQDNNVPVSFYFSTQFQFFIYLFYFYLYLFFSFFSEKQIWHLIQKKFSLCVKERIFQNIYFHIIFNAVISTSMFIIYLRKFDAT